MSLTGVHADYRGNRHHNGECGYSPLSVRGVTMCQCAGYPATTTQGVCTVCGGGYYETMDEFRADIPAIGCVGDGHDDYGNRCVGYADSVHPCTKCSAQHFGRVVVKEMTEVSPCTITAYVQGLNTPIEIKGVREDTITYEVRKGTRYLTYEVCGRGSAIGYVPDISHYTTELD